MAVEQYSQNPVGQTPSGFRHSGGEMASVQIVQHWDDGTATIVTATGKTSFPQALAELRATAVAAFIETLDALNARAE